MRVEPWLEDDDAAWDALCAAQGEFPQTSAATRAASVFGAETRRIRVLGDRGRAVAALAVMEIGLRRARAAEHAFARRFQIAGGPLVLVGDPREAGDLALRGVVEFARERGAVETAWKPAWPAMSAAIPFEAQGHATSRFGVAWRELPASPDEVAPTLSRVHRKAVRHAERAGVAVRETQSAEDLLPLVDASFRRSGLAPRNRLFLEDLHRRLAASGTLVGLVAGGPSGPLASLLAARCGDAVFNLFHGRADGETQGASNLLHLRLFERAVAMGCRRVHTGDAALEDEETGAAVAGITRFKRHLGFRVEPCASATLLHRPGARRVRSAVFGVYRLLRGTA